MGQRARHAWLLAGIAGYVDAACFLLYDAFAAQMTGNTVLLAIDLAKEEWVRAGHHLAIILAFLVGIWIATVAGRRSIGAWAPLLLSAGVVGAAGLLGTHWWVAALLAVGMGLQNATARHFGTTVLNTAFITGDMQKMVGSLSDPNPDVDTKRTGRLLAVLVLSYLAGAVFGAVMSQRLAYPLLVPATLMLLLLADVAHVERTGDGNSG